MSPRSPARPSRLARVLGKHDSDEKCVREKRAKPVDFGKVTGMGRNDNSLKALGCFGGDVALSTVAMGEATAAPLCQGAVAVAAAVARESLGRPQALTQQGAFEDIGMGVGATSSKASREWQSSPEQQATPTLHVASEDVDMGVAAAGSKVFRERCSSTEQQATPFIDPACGLSPDCSPRSPLSPVPACRSTASPGASPERCHRAIFPHAHQRCSDAASPQRPQRGVSFASTPVMQVIRHVPTPGAPSRGRAQHLERWEWEAMQHGGSSQWGDSELSDSDDMVTDRNAAD